MKFLNDILLIVVSIANIVLGLFVLLKNRKNPVNISFSLVALSVALWSFTLFMLWNPNQHPRILFWSNMTFLGPSLIPAFLLYFVLTFASHKEKTLSTLKNITIFMPVPILCLLIFSNLISTKVIELVPPTFDRGFGYPIFLGYYFSWMTFSFVKLRQKYKSAKGINRTQIAYIFWGTFLTTLIGSTFNAVLPAIGITGFNSLGPLSGLILVGVIAYAIVKHRLWDIRLIVARSVAYSCLVAIIGGFFVFTVSYLKQFYQNFMSQNIAFVITGLIAAFGFQPLRRLLEKYTDRFFAKGRYDSEKLLSQLGDLLSSKIELDDLTQSVLETLTKEIRLTKAAFVLINSLETLEIKALGYEKTIPTKSSWERAIKLSMEHKKTIVADELEEGSHAREVLRSLGIEVLIPLATEDKFAGLLALGEKRSGDMYTIQDLKLLEIIAPEAAIAIENAMLFKEKEKRIQELDALHNIALSLGSTLDLNALLRQVIDEAIKVTDAETGSIMLIDEQTNTLAIKVARGISPEITESTRIRMGEGIAGWVAKTSKPLVLINGQDVRFQDHLKREEIISALTVPLKVREKVIGVLSVNRKQNTQVFTEDNLRIITSFASQAAEAIENARLFENLENTFLGTISALAAAVDAKDHYTYGHSEMVTELAVDTAKELMLPEEEIKKIEIASKLHDIGKIGIDGAILNKPGKLTPEERRIIEEHPKIAVDILKSVEPLKDIVPLILYHHEKFDGNGYPLGLTGRSIPLGARILAAADAFNAMVSDRPYRPALDIAAAVGELEKNAGSQFDPEIVDAFLRAVKKKLAAKTLASI